MPHRSSDQHFPDRPHDKEHKPKAGGVHALLRLPDHGELFEEEWRVTQRRIEQVAAAPVPRETEPAGAPRLHRGE
jgi:hypothetical protein